MSTGKFVEIGGAGLAYATARLFMPRFSPWPRAAPTERWTSYTASAFYRFHGQVHRMPERGCRLRGAAGGSWKAGQALRGGQCGVNMHHPLQRDMLNLAGCWEFPLQSLAPGLFEG